MSISIIQRQLTDKELDLLIEEVKKFYSPVVGYKDKWKQFYTVYIAVQNNSLLGVCGIEKINDWLMLHPFIVLEKYQKQGIGKLLIEHIVNDNKESNIFIGSQHIVVARIVGKLGFKEVNPWKLPWRVMLYLLKFIVESLNISFIKERIRKRNLSHGEYKCFIKLCNYS